MMTNLSQNTRRAIVGLVGVSALICFLDYYASLNWFGGYDFYAMLGALVAMLIAVPFVGSGEQRRSK